jgi:tRNA threonylcarbamoyl adenosine modification protein YjeE
MRMTSPMMPAEQATAVATIDVADEAAMGRLAAELAAVLPPRVFVTLSGDLGAGKTTLVKAIAAAVGIDPTEVVSPTFGLIHTHHADCEVGGEGLRLVHADMYRLTGPGELAETGWDDAITGDAWVFVEWPERIASALPKNRIDVTITIVSLSARGLTFTARGPTAAGIVRGLTNSGR